MAKANKAISVVVPSLIVIVLIVIVGFEVYLSETSNSTTVTSLGSTETTTVSLARSSSTVATTSFSLASQEALNSTSGLRLDLLVAPSNGSKGEMLIDVDEYNTLDTSNNATAANEWRYSQDLLNPYNDCGASGPLGFAIFQGYYDLTNFTSGTALPLWNTTYVESCSSAIPITSYLFNPGGDVATIYNAMGPVSPFDTNASVSLSFTTEGYWTGGQYTGTPASFQEFPSGTYTVLAADEWGKVVLSYFTVAGTWTTFTFTTSSSAVNSTGQWSPGGVAKLVLTSPEVLSYVKHAYTYSLSIMQDPFATNLANALINVTETQSVSGNWTTGYGVTYSGVMLNATVQFTPPNGYQLISIGANNLPTQTYSINYNSTQQHVIQVALSNSTVENLLSKISPYYVNEVSGLVGNGTSAYYFSIGQVDGPGDVSGYINAAMTAVGSATLGYNGGGVCYYSPYFCYSVPWNSTYQ